MLTFKSGRFSSGNMPCFAYYLGMFAAAVGGCKHTANVLETTSAK